MSFFEKHYEYIEACAVARAWEIAYATGRYDIDDYKQDMLVHLIKQVHRYNPERACPHTFINMLMTSAKRTILRKMGRNKNRIISQARTLEYA